MAIIRWDNVAAPNLGKTTELAVKLQANAGNAFKQAIVAPLEERLQQQRQESINDFGILASKFTSPDGVIDNDGLLDAWTKNGGTPQDYIVGKQLFKEVSGINKLEQDQKAQAERDFKYNQVTRQLNNRTALNTQDNTAKLKVAGIRAKTQLLNSKNKKSGSNSKGGNADFSSLYNKESNDAPLDLFGFLNNRNDAAYNQKTAIEYSAKGVHPNTIKDIFNYHYDGESYFKNKNKIKSDLNEVLTTQKQLGVGSKTALSILLENRANKTNYKGRNK